MLSRYQSHPHIIQASNRALIEFAQFEELVNRHPLSSLMLAISSSAPSCCWLIACPSQQQQIRSIPVFSHKFAFQKQIRFCYYFKTSKVEHQILLLLENCFQPHQQFYSSAITISFYLNCFIKAAPFFFMSRDSKFLSISLEKKKIEFIKPNIVRVHFPISPDFML